MKREEIGRILAAGTLAALVGAGAARLLLACEYAPEPVAPSPPKRTLYDGYATPAWILRAHARAESDETDWAIGDDGRSRGRMQINEDYHAERAAAWGEYDPHNVYDALRIADRVWQENARHFAEAWRGDPDTWAARRFELTVAAYRQGWRGASRGATYWYFERVMGRAK
jgi:hypothetical protein